MYIILAHFPNCHNTWSLMDRQPECSFYDCCGWNLPSISDYHFLFLISCLVNITGPLQVTRLVTTIQPSLLITKLGQVVLHTSIICDNFSNLSWMWQIDRRKNLIEKVDCSHLWSGVYALRIKVKELRFVELPRYTGSFLQWHSYWIILTTLWGACFHSHFSDEGCEAQRGQIICPRLYK